MTASHQLALYGAVARPDTRRSPDCTSRLPVDLPALFCLFSTVYPIIRLHMVRGFNIQVLVHKWDGAGGGGGRVSPSSRETETPRRSKIQAQNPWKYNERIWGQGTQ